MSLGGTGDQILPLSLRVLLEDGDHLVGVDDHAVVALDDVFDPRAVLMWPDVAAEDLVPEPPVTNEYRVLGHVISIDQWE